MAVSRYEESQQSALRLAGQFRVPELIELIADLVGTTDVTLILSLWRQQIIAAAHRVSGIEANVSVDLGLAPAAKD